MTNNAGFKFNNRIVSENYTTFDGNVGQTVTLEEYVRQGIENQNRIKSKPVSEFLPKSNRQIIESKLNRLFDEDYDEEFLQPTDEIFRVAKRILLTFNDFLGYEMSVPSFIIPDGEGGIRIEWKVNNKHLRLALSEKKLYLYFEHNGVSDGIQNFNAEQLEEKLRWLNKQ